MRLRSIVIKIIVFIASTGLIFSQSDFAKSQYQKALSEYKEKKYNEAVTTLEAVEKENPYYLDASILLIDTYIALKNYNRANAVAENLLKYHANNTRAFERMLQIRLLQNDKTKSQNLISHIKKLDNKNYYAAYAEGVIAERDGHSASAVKLYENARKLDRTRTEANASLAYIYIISGQKERGLGLFKENITLQPQNEMHHYNLANYYYQNNMFAEALSKIEEAYSYYPKYSKAKILEIQTLGKMKRYDEAIAVINTASDNIFDGIKYYLLGALHEEKGDYENAKQSYREHLKKNPNDEISRLAYERNLIKTTGSNINAERQRAAQYYTALAKKYANQGDMERSQFYYKRMLRLNPSDINARLGLSYLYNKKGYYEKYLEELGIAKNINSDDKNISYRYESDKRRFERTIPSIEWGISQYNIQEGGMSIAVINAISAKNEPNYIAELAALETIALAINQYPRINSLSLYTNGMSKSEFINKADRENIDFYLEGSLTEKDDSIILDINLIDRITRTPLARFTAKNTGKEKFVNSAISIANQINKTLPHYGKIIKINGSSIYISGGKRHGITNGMEYVIYNGTPSFNINEKNIAQNKSDMVGMARVETVDENVSLIKLKDTRVLQNVKLGQFVTVYVPPNTNNTKK